MTIPESRFSSSSVGSANSTELQISKIHLCQLFLSWLIGIPKHRYEVKETTKHVQSGEEETELRSVRMQKGIKEGVGSISCRTNIEGLKITENASEGTAALITLQTARPPRGSKDIEIAVPSPVGDDKTGTSATSATVLLC